MYICRDCDRPFIEADYQRDIDGEEAPVCPYCGSESIFTPSEYDGME